MEKKFNCQGFSLLETLIVSIFIVGVLLVLYTQYVVLQKNYDNTYRYNAVGTVYNTKQLTNFLESKEASFVIQNIGATGAGYVDITSCQGLANEEYCQALLEELDVKTVLVTDNNPQKLITDLTAINPYTENLYQFLKHIDVNTGKKYRVIVEYQNGELSSLNLEIG